jgi:hypothetical protein
VEFRTRSKSCVLRDLVAKLERLSHNHPDRPHLIRMVLGLRRELDPASTEPTPDPGPGASQHG